MAKFTFKNVAVKGISAVVPEKELSILDDKELYGGDEKKIKRVINSSGFLYRRVADENTTTADLCEQAANKLLEEMNIDKNTIDGLLFISYTPDYLMPATSYVLHKKLGLSENCICADIPQACSGFLFGLYQASMMINSGCKRILLLVGDTFSKFSDMFINHTAPVFGDAGTATILEYEENAEPIYFNINSCGENYDALICKNGGFRNIPKKDDFYENGNFMYESKMDGGRIFDFTMSNITPNIKELLEYSNKDIKDFDYYVFHQANKFILQNIARQLDVSEEKIPMTTLTNYGNQCGASIPCTISDVLSEAVSTNDNKVLMSGFGVGLSWISAIVELNKIYCTKLENYKGV